MDYKHELVEAEETLEKCEAFKILLNEIFPDYKNYFPKLLSGNQDDLVDIDILIQNKITTYSNRKRILEKVILKNHPSNKG